MNLEDRLPQSYKGFMYRKSNNAFILNSDDFENAKKIMLQDNLCHLEINPNYFKNNDLSFLKDFSFITEFSILGLNINNINVIESLTNLKKLYIAHKFKGSIDFTVFKNLNECIFTWGIKGCETIFETTKLNFLTIYSFGLEDFSKFYKLFNLEKLSLLNPKINSLNSIENVPYLKELVIIGAKNLDNLKNLDKLQNLEILRIDRCQKIHDLSILGNLKKLRKITANDGLQIKCLDFIDELDNLEEFVFAGNTKVVNGDLSPLARSFDNRKLKRIMFMDRKYYTHKRSCLGYDNWINKSEL